VDGADRKRLTAREGEVLVALEFLLNRMARRSWPEETVVHLSCAGFHPGRDDELVHLVREVAAQVAASGRPKTLHPMNPYERRVVHVTVREISGLTTVSEGDGFLKRIRVEKIAP
jgi:spoIIIJ-associated protein